MNLRARKHATLSCGPKRAPTSLPFPLPQRVTILQHNNTAAEAAAVAAALS